MTGTPPLLPTIQGERAVTKEIIRQQLVTSVGGQQLSQQRPIAQQQPVGQQQPVVQQIQLQQQQLQRQQLQLQQQAADQSAPRGEVPQKACR